MSDVGKKRIEWNIVCDICERAWPERDDNGLAIHGVLVLCDDRHDPVTGKVRHPEFAVPQTPEPQTTQIRDETGTYRVEVTRNADGTVTVGFGSSFTLSHADPEDVARLAALLGGE